MINADMRRFLSEHERDKYYMSWVSKNGFPKKNQGCINCAELICYDNCKGIEDRRVKRISQ